MTQQKANLHLPRLTLFALLLTTQVFSGESNSDTKSESPSQTTSSESSSPSYGYTFYHYRRPRYSQKHPTSKSVSTYNGHPHFSYGKMTAYHAAPALTTYDAGLGSYAPTYDSMGGYKDLEYEQQVKTEQNKHQTYTHDYEKCPYKHDSEAKQPEKSERPAKIRDGGYPAKSQDDEHHGPSSEFKEEISQYDSSSHEDVDYKPHDESKYEVSNQNYGKNQHSGYYAHSVSTNQGGHYENYPVYEGGRFVYTIYTDHGRPVYRKPVKQYSHEASYQSHGELHHYQHAKYPTYSKLKYQTNYQQELPYKPPKKEKEEKYKHTSSKYPSEDEHEDKETKHVYQQYAQPEYNKDTKHLTKYPSADDHQEEKEESNYGTHYSMSQNSPHSSYVMQVHIPWSSFKCHDHYHPGFYADVQSHCSIWHYCQPDGRQDSFKCAKGTLFNQKSLTCDWWFNVDCENSPHYYGNNQELYKLYGHPHHGQVDTKSEQMIHRSAIPSPSSKRKTKRPQIVIVSVKNKSKTKKKN